MSAKYRKLVFITKWIFLNALASVLFLIFLSLRIANAYEIIILAIGVLITFISVMKGLFAFLFFIEWWCIHRYKRSNFKAIEGTRNNAENKI
jgi:hypothetical protein